MKDNTGEKNEKNPNINALLQSMVEGMILQDTSGKIIQYNQAFLDIFGIPEENTDYVNNINSQIDENSEWAKIFPRKNHIGMNSFSTCQIQRNIELRIFRFDGEVRWISLNAVPIINSNQNDNQLICTFTDTTEMKRILNDFKQVQLLYNISHDIMIIANQEGYFKKINPRFITVLGYTLNEITSLKFIDFVHDDDIKLTQIKMNKMLINNNSIHFINRYKTKKNDYRIFDWVIVPDSETNLIYFTARDITDYQAEELDIIHSSKVYSVGELASGIAFSLNREFSIVSNHLSYIKSHLTHDQIDSKDFDEKIKSIEESISKLSKTTKELTTFTRFIENERETNISLNRILESVIELSKERFRIHGVNLNIKLENNLIIRSKESQIAHVFLCILNMAYNSVHTKRDGWVEVNANVINKFVRITITSSEPFIEELDQRKSSISKKIIEENTGTYYIDNLSNQTQVVIEFPLVKDDIDNE